MFKSICSFLMSLVSADVIAPTEFGSGVFGHCFEVVGGWFLDLWQLICEGFYGICKWFLAFVDFLQYFIQKLIGLDYWLNNNVYTMDGAIKSDLLFSFLYNETVQRVFQTMIAVFLVLLIIFTIFAIIKNEWTYITGKEFGDGKGNSKVGIMRSAMKAIAIVLIFPIMLIVGIISSNAILASLVKALNIDMSSTFGGTLFYISSNQANKYRIYSQNNARMPVSDQVSFYIVGGKYVKLVPGRSSTTDDNRVKYVSTYEEYLTEINKPGAVRYTVNSVFDRIVPDDGDFSGYCVRIFDKDHDYWMLVRCDSSNSTAMYYYLNNVLGLDVMSRDAEIGNKNLQNDLKSSMSNTIGSKGFIQNYNTNKCSSGSEVAKACYNTWNYATVYEATTSFEDGENFVQLDVNTLSNVYGLGVNSAKIMLNENPISGYFDGGQFGVVQLQAEYRVMGDVIDFMQNNNLRLYMIDATSGVINWNYSSDYTIETKWIGTGATGTAGAQIQPKTIPSDKTYNKREAYAFAVSYSEDCLDTEYGNVLYTATKGVGSEIEGSKYIMCFKVQNGTTTQYIPLLNNRTYTDPLTKSTYRFSSDCYSANYHGVVFAKGTFDSSVVKGSVGAPTYLKLTSSKISSSISGNEPYYFDMVYAGQFKQSIANNGVVQGQEYNISNISFTSADSNIDFSDYVVKISDDKTYYEIGKIDTESEDNSVTIQSLNESMITNLSLTLSSGSSVYDGSISKVSANGETAYVFVTSDGYYHAVVADYANNRFKIVGFNANDGSLRSDNISNSTTDPANKLVAITQNYNLTYKYENKSQVQEDSVATIKPSDIEFSKQDSKGYVFQTKEVYSISKDLVKTNLRFKFYTETNSADFVSFKNIGNKMVLGFSAGTGNDDSKRFGQINYKINLYNYYTAFIEADGTRKETSEFSGEFSDAREPDGSDPKWQFSIKLDDSEFSWATNSNSYGLYDGKNYVATIYKNIGEPCANIDDIKSSAISILYDYKTYYNIRTQNAYATVAAAETYYKSLADSSVVQMVRDNASIKACFDWHFGLSNFRAKLSIGTKVMSRSHVAKSFNIANGVAFDYFFDNNTGVGLSTFFLASKVSYWLILVASILIIKVLGTSIWGVIKRFYEITLYFIAAPAVASTMPIDESRFNNQIIQPLIKKILSTYGVILGINVFFILLMPVKSMSNIFTAEDIATSGSYFLQHLPFFNDANRAKVLNLYVYILFMLVAFTMIEALPGLISGLIGGEDILDSGKKTKESVQKTASSALNTLSGANAVKKIGNIKNGFNNLPIVAGTKGAIQKIKNAGDMKKKAEDEGYQNAVKGTSGEATENSSKSSRADDDGDETENDVSAENVVTEGGAEGNEISGEGAVGATDANEGAAGATDTGAGGAAGTVADQISQKIVDVDDQQAENFAKQEFENDGKAFEENGSVNEDKEASVIKDLAGQGNESAQKAVVQAATEDDLKAIGEQNIDKSNGLGVDANAIVSAVLAALGPQIEAKLNKEGKSGDLAKLNDKNATADEKLQVLTNNGYGLKMGQDSNGAVSFSATGKDADGNDVTGAVSGNAEKTLFAQVATNLTQNGTVDTLSSDKLVSGAQNAGIENSIQQQYLQNQTLGMSNDVGSLDATGLAIMNKAKQDENIVADATLRNLLASGDTETMGNLGLMTSAGTALDYDAIANNPQLYNQTIEAMKNNESIKEKFAPTDDNILASINEKKIQYSAWELMSDEDKAKRIEDTKQKYNNLDANSILNGATEADAEKIIATTARNTISQNPNSALARQIQTTMFASNVGAEDLAKMDKNVLQAAVGGWGLMSATDKQGNIDYNKLYSSLSDDKKALFGFMKSKNGGDLSKVTEENVQANKVLFNNATERANVFSKTFSDSDIATELMVTDKENGTNITQTLARAATLDATLAGAASKDDYKSVNSNYQSGNVRTENEKIIEKNMSLNEVNISNQAKALIRTSGNQMGNQFIDSIVNAADPKSTQQALQELQKSKNSAVYMSLSAQGKTDDEIALAYKKARLLGVDFNKADNDVALAKMMQLSDSNADNTKDNLTILNKLNFNTDAKKQQAIDAAKAEFIDQNLTERQKQNLNNYAASNGFNVAGRQDQNKILESLAKEDGGIAERLKNSGKSLEEYLNSDAGAQDKAILSKRAQSMSLYEINQRLNGKSGENIYNEVSKETEKQQLAKQLLEDTEVTSTEINNQLKKTSNKDAQKVYADAYAEANSNLSKDEKQEAFNIGVFEQVVKNEGSEAAFLAKYNYRSMNEAKTNMNLVVNRALAEDETLNLAGDEAVRKANKLSLAKKNDASIKDTDSEEKINAAIVSKMADSDVAKITKDISESGDERVNAVNSLKQEFAMEFVNSKTPDLQKRKENQENDFVNELLKNSGLEVDEVDATGKKTGMRTMTAADLQPEEREALLKGVEKGKSLKDLDNETIASNLKALKEMHTGVSDDDSFRERAGFFRKKVAKGDNNKVYKNKDNSVVRLKKGEEVAKDANGEPIYDGNGNVVKIKADKRLVRDAAGNIVVGQNGKARKVKKDVYNDEEADKFFNVDESGYFTDLNIKNKELKKKIEDGAKVEAIDSSYKTKLVADLKKKNGGKDVSNAEILAELDARAKAGDTDAAKYIKDGATNLSGNVRMYLSKNTDDLSKLRDQLYIEKKFVTNANGEIIKDHFGKAVKKGIVRKNVATEFVDEIDKATGRKTGRQIEKVVRNEKGKVIRSIKQKEYARTEAGKLLYDEKGKAARLSRKKDASAQKKIDDETIVDSLDKKFKENIVKDLQGGDTKKKISNAEIVAEMEKRAKANDYAAQAALDKGKETITKRDNKKYVVDKNGNRVLDSRGRAIRKGYRFWKGGRVETEEAFEDQLQSDGKVHRVKVTKALTDKNGKVFRTKGFRTKMSTYEDVEYDENGREMRLRKVYRDGNGNYVRKGLGKKRFKPVTEQELVTKTGLDGKTRKVIVDKLVTGKNGKAARKGWFRTQFAKTFVDEIDDNGNVTSVEKVIRDNSGKAIRKGFRKLQTNTEFGKDANGNRIVKSVYAATNGKGKVIRKRFKKIAFENVVDDNGNVIGQRVAMNDKGKAMKAGLIWKVQKDAQGQIIRDEKGNAVRHKQPNVDKLLKFFDEDNKTNFNAKNSKNINRDRALRARIGANYLKFAKGNGSITLKDYLSSEQGRQDLIDLNKQRQIQLHSDKVKVISSQKIANFGWGYQTDKNGNLIYDKNGRAIKKGVFKGRKFLGIGNKQHVETTKDAQGRDIIARDANGKVIYKGITKVIKDQDGKVVLNKNGKAVRNGFAKFVDRDNNGNVIFDRKGNVKKTSFIKKGLYGSRIEGGKTNSYQNIVAKSRKATLQKNISIRDTLENSMPTDFTKLSKQAREEYNKNMNILQRSMRSENGAAIVGNAFKNINLLNENDLVKKIIARQTGKKNFADVNINEIKNILMSNPEFAKKVADQATKMFGKNFNKAQFDNVALRLASEASMSDIKKGLTNEAIYETAKADEKFMKQLLDRSSRDLTLALDSETKIKRVADGIGSSKVLQNKFAVKALESEYDEAKIKKLINEWFTFHNKDKFASNNLLKEYINKNYEKIKLDFARRRYLLNENGETKVNRKAVSDTKFNKIIAELSTQAVVKEEIYKNTVKPVYSNNDAAVNRFFNPTSNSPVTKKSMQQAIRDRRNVIFQGGMNVQDRRDMERIKRELAELNRRQRDLKRISDMLKDEVDNPDLRKYKKMLEEYEYISVIRAKDKKEMLSEIKAVSNENRNKMINLKASLKNYKISKSTLARMKNATPKYKADTSSIIKQIEARPTISQKDVVEIKSKIAKFERELDKLNNSMSKLTPKELADKITDLLNNN